MTLLTELRENPLPSKIRLGRHQSSSSTMLKQTGFSSRESDSLYHLKCSHNQQANAYTTHLSRYHIHTKDKSLHGFNYYIIQRIIVQGSVQAPQAKSKQRKSKSGSYSWASSPSWMKSSHRHDLSVARAVQANLGAMSQSLK